MSADLSLARRCGHLVEQAVATLFPSGGHAPSGNAGGAVPSINAGSGRPRHFDGTSTARGRGRISAHRANPAPRAPEPADPPPPASGNSPAPLLPSAARVFSEVAP